MLTQLFGDQIPTLSAHVFVILDLTLRLIELYLLLLTITVLRGFLLLIRASKLTQVIDRLSSEQLYTLAFGHPPRKP